MELLYRLLDRLDSWFVGGLLGAVAASFWHKDDLVYRQAWAIFIFFGRCVRSLSDGIGQHLPWRGRASQRCR